MKKGKSKKQINKSLQNGNPFTNFQYTDKQSCASILDLYEPFEKKYQKMEAFMTCLHKSRQKTLQLIKNKNEFIKNVFYISNDEIVSMCLPSLIESNEPNQNQEIIHKENIKQCNIPVVIIQHNPCKDSP